MTQKIINGLQLWLLTLVIPICMTIITILWFIIGFEMKHTFIEYMEIWWIKYYFTGVILNLKAWRIHLGLLFLCEFISLTSD